MAVVLVVRRRREGGVVCIGMLAVVPSDSHGVPTSPRHVGIGGRGVAPEVGRRVAPPRMGGPGRHIGGRGLGEDVGRRVDVGRVGGTLVGRQGGQRFVHLGGGSRGRFLRLLAAAGHERLVARHAEDALRGTGIAQVFDLPLAVAAPEAVCTKGLVASQDGQVLDLVAAVVAAVGAVVAYQRAVAEQQQVRVRVEESAARVAAEAVDVPSVPRCVVSVLLPLPFDCLRLHTELKRFSLLEYLRWR